MAERREALQVLREDEPLRPMGESRPGRIGAGFRGGRPAVPGRQLPSVSNSTVVPRGTLRGFSAPQKVLFATWVAAVGLRAFQDVRTTRDWPCPGPILKISALYLILGLASEVAPGLAAWLGVGFFIAYMTRVGGREVQQKGTFFGVKVQQR